MASDLIHAGANVSARRNDGATPIHVAVKNNQPRMTEVLVKAMANLSLLEVSRPGQAHSLIPLVKLSP